jgi:V8-like Glu-specific endopeptidase
MSWDEAIVRVSAGGGSGTGCFIAPKTILTAGHVLFPSDRQTPFEVDEVEVRQGELAWKPRALRIHPLWLGSRSRSADLAIINVTSPGSEKLECLLDFNPSPRTTLAVNGYARNPEFEHQTGAFTLLGEPSERYYLHTTEVNVVDGLSGAPLLRGKLRPKVVGVAVWGDGQIGLAVPLLVSTFGVLLRRKK